MWVKHGRRLITIPSFTLLATAYVALLPPLLAYGVLADLLRRRPMLLLRFHLTMAGVLVWHVVGLVLLLAYWLGCGLWSGVRPRRWLAYNRRLEGWWGSWVIAIAERCYGMRIEVTGDREAFARGPVLVFARHTSVIDTMLPLRLIEHWHGMTARIVKKRILLWDPCVDVVSHRMPRTYVRRDSNNHGRELELVRRLTEGMGPHDALWMYPEGTRFTPSKRARVIDKLRSGHPDAAARAEALRFTMPPRPGGTMALLDACPGTDVVFCAHTGMEGANRLENFINGSLLRRRVRVELWRVPAAEIPADAQARLVWLHEWWTRIDRWVEAHQDPDLTELLSGE